MTIPVSGQYKFNVIFRSHKPISDYYRRYWLSLLVDGNAGDREAKYSNYGYQTSSTTNTNTVNYINEIDLVKGQKVTVKVTYSQQEYLSDLSFFQASLVRAA